MASPQPAEAVVEVEIHVLPEGRRRPPRRWVLRLLAGVLVASTGAGIAWRVARSQEPSPREVYLALAETPLESLPPGFTCGPARCSAGNLKELQTVGPGVVGEVVETVVGPEGRRHVVAFRVFARGHSPAVPGVPGTGLRMSPMPGLEDPLRCASTNDPQPEIACAGRAGSVTLEVTSRGSGASIDETLEVARAAAMHLLGVLDQ